MAHLGKWVKGCERNWTQVFRVGTCLGIFTVQVLFLAWSRGPGDTCVRCGYWAFCMLNPNEFHLRIMRSLELQTEASQNIFLNCSFHFCFHVFVRLFFHFVFSFFCFHVFRFFHFFVFIFVFIFSLFFRLFFFSFPCLFSLFFHIWRVETFTGKPHLDETSKNRGKWKKKTQKKMKWKKTRVFFIFGGLKPSLANLIWTKPAKTEAHEKTTKKWKKIWKPKWQKMKSKMKNIFFKMKKNENENEKNDAGNENQNEKIMKKTYFQLFQSLASRASPPNLRT